MSRSLALCACSLAQCSILFALAVGSPSDHNALLALYAVISFMFWLAGRAITKKAGGRWANPLQVSSDLVLYVVPFLAFAMFLINTLVGRFNDPLLYAAGITVYFGIDAWQQTRKTSLKSAVLHCGIALTVGATQLLWTSVTLASVVALMLLYAGCVASLITCLSLLAETRDTASAVPLQAMAAAPTRESYRKAA